jgi:DNA-repair protein complementing XP-A cells
MDRPKTPPLRRAAPDSLTRSPPTPEVTRRIVGHRSFPLFCSFLYSNGRQEENRLKAKAIRDQREAAERQKGTPAIVDRTPSGFVNGADISIAGRKRSHAAISTAQIPETQRDARNAPAPKMGGSMFSKYVEYDFSKMTDTKGGFLTAEDDPHNKALHRLLRSLRNRKDGPFEPGLSVLDKEGQKKCRECGSLEIDWTWDEVFHCAICTRCKEKYPEKYSLLTKTEVKDDYLITERKLSI